ncbi:nuclease-related domain-containing protein [Virgibacillus doumboii]|uniref:nuclease-related domain-containing protein n=1 Tax=Virgibacillus doumboii TaxID=2697503 RepID=UPI0013E0AFDF|nr:nuclease-related domain-containing protein [Virgibacillus doumboii]
MFKSICRNYSFFAEIIIKYIEGVIPLFINNRKKPYALLFYEALFRNLKEQYRENNAIISGYKKEKAGYDGECNVDYKLATYPHKKDFFPIKGIRLENPPFHFQTDTLLPTRKFFSIFEIKNLKGKVTYDSKQHQFTQEYKGETTAYKDPILQAEAQKSHLQMLLESKGIYGIPIETVVVIAYPTTIFENFHQDPYVYEKIIHTESLHQHLDKLNNKYTREHLTFPALKKIQSSLLRANTPLRSNPLNNFNLEDKHFIKGIACSVCNHYPLQRVYKKWLCPRCKHISFDAHVRKILDYFLIHGTTITNRQCRELLQIGSGRTANVCLNSMDLSVTGDNKGRKYHSPRISDFPQDSVFPYIKNITKEID